ncbi:tyrosine-type recombinase/integrase [Kribbella sp. NPDC056345]|uniref:tyrosine-type recombinase/integrase n=1 Tax=Kribbella sp. NPDC056345 TaxID=3345789 RepID=UPI0035DFE770
MARPTIPRGSWGTISTWPTKTDAKGKAVQHKAQAKFRDMDGHIRPVSAYGPTKTAAERSLLKKLQDRTRTGHSNDLTAMHKIDALIDLWEQKFKQLIELGKRSPTSYDTYERVIRNHIRPAIAELRIGEATTQRLDKVISTISDRSGTSTAKTARAIVSGMMSLAVRYGAITTNPMREIEAIEGAPKNPPRALTAEEVTLLRRSLAADPRAVDADLPDLVAFMLGTGVRIGEALAVTWSQVDLEAGTVEITHTIARVRSQGLLRPKLVCPSPRPPSRFPATLTAENSSGSLQRNRRHYPLVHRSRSTPGRCRCTGANSRMTTERVHSTRTLSAPAALCVVFQAVPWFVVRDEVPGLDVDRVDPVELLAHPAEGDSVDLLGERLDLDRLQQVFAELGQPGSDEPLRIGRTSLTWRKPFRTTNLVDPHLVERAVSLPQEQSDIGRRLIEQLITQEEPPPVLSSPRIRHVIVIRNDPETRGCSMHHNSFARVRRHQGTACQYAGHRTHVRLLPGRRRGRCWFDPHDM